MSVSKFNHFAACLIFLHSEKDEAEKARDLISSILETEQITKEMDKDED